MYTDAGNFSKGSERYTTQTVSHIYYGSGWVLSLVLVNTKLFFKPQAI